MSSPPRTSQVGLSVAGILRLTHVFPNVQQAQVRGARPSRPSAPPPVVLQSCVCRGAPWRDPHLRAHDARDRGNSPTCAQFRWLWEGALLKLSGWMRLQTLSLSQLGYGGDWRLLRTLPVRRPRLRPRLRDARATPCLRAQQGCT